MTGMISHRPQCYCLSRHLLAVPSFSMHGIIIASIKLSDFRLFSSMSRRLLIKRSDVWSKSEGVIKLTKVLSFKRGLLSSQDFCQQSRLQRHSLFFFVDMPHSQRFEGGSEKFSHKKFFLQSVAKWKCGAWNTCIYFIAVLFYSTGQSSSSETLFYFDFTGSVYVVCTLIKDLKDNTGPFYLYDGGENKNKLHFCLNTSHDWASIVFHCFCEIIIQNWIRFNSRGNFKVSPSYCHARLTEGTKQEL